MEGDRVVLCAGALKSPHILMLSGTGPRDQLEEHGIPVRHESPGVGQNPFNHPMGNVTFMPQVTRANTNATAIMIGERAADWTAATG